MSTKKKSTVPALPDGLFDIIPGHQKYWHHLWRKANSLLSDYSFDRLDLSPLELTEVFTRPVAQSDPDRAKHLVTGRVRGASVALRADAQASIMRCYLEHGMHSSEPHPVKMFVNGPVLVPTERGHTMRYRITVQTIGESSEAVDAELLFLGCRLMEALNLGPYLVRINTIGDVLGRPAYLRALRDFAKHHQKKISAKAAALFKEHPFKGVAQLALEDAELTRELPQSVDFLSDESRLYFKRLLEFLDEGKVPYIIDTTLLTTDDFAANTVWEFVLDPLAAVQAITAEDGTESGGLPAQDSVAVLRGGRMDRLAELLGGPKTSASGWVLDGDLIVARLAARNVTMPDPQHHAKVFLSQLGDAAKKKSLMLFEDIRKAGIDVRYSLSRDTIKGQLRMASRYGAKLALIFGQKEALEGTVMVREMETGIQETIPQEKIIDELRKRLRSK